MIKSRFNFGCQEGTFSYIFSPVELSQTITLLPSSSEFRVDIKLPSLLQEKLGEEKILPSPKSREKFIKQAHVSISHIFRTSPNVANLESESDLEQAISFILYLLRTLKNLTRFPLPVIVNDISIFQLMVFYYFILLNISNNPFNSQIIKNKFYKKEENNNRLKSTVAGKL